MPPGSFRTAEKLLISQQTGHGVTTGLKISKGRLLARTAMMQLWRDLLAGVRVGAGMDHGGLGP